MTAAINLAASFLRTNVLVDAAIEWVLCTAHILWASMMRNKFLLDAAIQLRQKLIRECFAHINLLLEIALLEKQICHGLPDFDLHISKRIRVGLQQRNFCLQHLTLML